MATKSCNSELTADLVRVCWGVARFALALVDATGILWLQNLLQYTAEEHSGEGERGGSEGFSYTKI